MTIRTVILAAGHGKRMHSALPKVLHHLAGRPLLEHVIVTVLRLFPTLPPIIVYGHQGHVLRNQLAYYSACWIEQNEQLGTGHAVKQILPAVLETDQLLILYGDVPLISEQTLKRLIDLTPKDAIGLLTCIFSDPSGYGRIKRDQDGCVMEIVEEKDATLKELAITEINTGIYLIPANHLKKWLPHLENKNRQREYYLTDIISMAVQENISIQTVQPACVEEIYGVNDKIELAKLERFYQKQQAEKFMRQGVTVMDPARLDIRGEVKIGCDVLLDVNIIFEGHVIIGNECVIGPNTILRNTQLGDRVEVKANSVIDGAEIGADCVIGPFARIRPGTVLDTHIQVGNFVELKNSEVNKGTKINHLSYLGDSKIGKQVNIGAGTITCNYNGVNKYKTVIDDYAFIGSCTQLIAPVTIGEGATIGAGSTITRDAPPWQLTLTRVLQRSIKDWRRPEKKE
jgi:bifunctional UDP-N-acetylglucosamine pyrophosphorylase/glucosamine-1-phosphate N-acetyltransferase